MDDTQGKQPSAGLPCCRRGLHTEVHALSRALVCVRPVVGRGPQEHQLRRLQTEKFTRLQLPECSQEHPQGIGLVELERNRVFS